MSDDVTNAPNPPGKDPLTPGKYTTEFLMTGAGMFLTALFGLLATFNVITFNADQKMSIYEFVGIAWIVLPAAYTWARSHVKAKAVSSAGAATAVAKVDG